VTDDERGRIDEQFSLGEIADLEGLRARRAAAAEAALARFEVRRAVPYGERPGETLNIVPAGEGAPVMVFIHGGFWISLDADLFSFLAPAFVPFGAALVAIDYPLMPSARMGELVDACLRAVDWVHDNAPTFGADPARLFVSGNSAGGHLVAEVMDRAARGRIAGGTAISGLFDLAPVTRASVNEEIGLTAQEVADFSPLKRPLDLSAPLLVAVGGDETDIFLQQSHALAAHCGTEAMVVPGTDHITVVLDALANPDNALNEAVRRQMALPAEP
jgi:arylformamidase